jgi:uncharacterized membrane protein
MTQQLIADSNIETHKNLARMLYFVHGLTFFFSLGLLSIIPVIINYTKRSDSAGTFVHSHHSWMIRSFWWFVIWMGIGWAFFITILGAPLSFLIWGVVWLWKAYRLIRGFIDLNADKAMPG